MSNWNIKLLKQAEFLAKQFSKDPTTCVGSLIVDTAHSIRSVGYNGICRNVEDKPERMVRPNKYKWMQHAECNAIVNCARMGVSTDNCKIYTTHFPCSTCCGMIINAGINGVIVLENTMTEDFKTRWQDDIDISKVMLAESNVSLEIISIDN